VSGLPRRRVALVVGLVVAFLAGATALDRLTRAPSGPRSSAYATAPGGLAAMASLLERDGRRVERLRRPPADALPSTDATLVLLDATLTADDTAAVRAWVRRGGRLLTGGAAGHGIVRALLDDAPRGGRAAGTSARPLVPAAELVGVAAVRTAGEAAWVEAGAGVPLLGPPDASLVVAAEAGRGRILALADASPLQNRLLGEADNARLALGLAGAPGGRVAFVESVHGYGVVEGLAALPVRARAALALLVAAALLLVLARARRLGPPEDEERAPAPARSLYLESLAAVLARTKDPAGAAPPLQDAVRRRLARRLGGDPDDADLPRQAGTLGLDGPEVAAVFEPVTTEDGLVRLARVHARLAGPATTGSAREEG
jgi:hypothetical protein